MCRKDCAHPRKLRILTMIPPVNGVPGADKGSVVQPVQIVQSLLRLPRVHGERKGLRKRFERSAAVDRLERFEPIPRLSAAAREDHRQLRRCNNFKLVIGAVARLFVRTPSAELRRVTEAIALHVIVSDFDNQLGTERLPGQILCSTPAALGARHAMLSISAGCFLLRPTFPWVGRERVLAVWGEKFHELAPLLVGEAGANADVLKRAGAVEKTEQE